MACGHVHAAVRSRLLQADARLTSPLTSGVFQPVRTELRCLLHNVHRRSPVCTAAVQVRPAVLTDFVVARHVAALSELPALPC
jgi:hypothetical protein